MTKIEMSVALWSAHINKKNLDYTMGNLAKSLEYIVSSMAQVDGKITQEVLEDMAKQVAKQRIKIEEETSKEKGSFIQQLLADLGEDEDAGNA